MPVVKKGLFDVSGLLEEDFGETPTQSAEPRSAGTAEGVSPLESTSAFGDAFNGSDETPRAPAPRRATRALEGTASPEDTAPPEDFAQGWDDGEESAPEQLIGANAGNYQILSVIASGTFSHVYGARHRSLGIDCALKVLRGRYARNENLRRRVRAEGERLVFLRHPNLVQTFEVSALEDGRPFLAMELLRGPTLEQVIEAFGPLSPEETVAVGLQVASGLAALHEAGLVHRDLKPENLILEGARGAEQVKILDLGLARWLGGGDRTQLTANNELLGTPAYMAPEQIRDPTTAGPRSDLYALGAILHHMLTGRLLFEGNAPAILRAHLEDRAPKLPALGGLEQIVAKLLKKDPKDRYESAQVVIRALRSVPRGEDLAAPPASRSRRYTALGYGMASALLVLLGFLISDRLGVAPTSPSPPAPPVSSARPETTVRPMVSSTATPEPSVVSLAAAAPDEPPPRDRGAGPRRDEHAGARMPEKTREPKVERREAERHLASAEARRVLHRALGRRALHEEDGPSLLGAAWRDAALAMEEGATQDVLDRVVRAIETAPLDDALLKSRLARILARLEALSRTASYDETEALERRYLALRGDLKDASGAEALARINAAADELERALGVR